MPNLQVWMSLMNVVVMADLQRELGKQIYCLCVRE